MPNLELAERVSEIAPVLPEEGIVYRLDRLAGAQRSLQRLSAHYILFSPDTQSDSVQCDIGLQAGVQFGLQYAYPYKWGIVPYEPLPNDYDGHSAHYARHPDDLPAISWGTSSHPGQFEAIRHDGSNTTSRTRHGHITVGSVRRHGPIAQTKTGQVVTATLEDILSLEDATVVPDTEGPVGIKKQKLSRIDYLRGPGRYDFHERPGRLMAHRLLDAVESEFLH